ncbi:roundabout homolog 2-like [Argopecten irradians]|uniref:roundabout homolog 2-like n=1 Tax=Argopecten irradians TaxID=31199 RepID=UPI00371DB7DC
MVGGDAIEPGVPIVSIAQSGYVVLAGQIAVLRCTILSPEPVTSVKWYRINKEDGQESAIEVDNNKYFGGSTESPSLVINNTDRHDEGLYMCRAVNGKGEGESPPAFLRIYVDDEVPKIEGRPISGHSNDETPGIEEGGQFVPCSG